MRISILEVSLLVGLLYMFIMVVSIIAAAVILRVLKQRYRRQERDRLPAVLPRQEGFQPTEAEITPV